MLNELGFFFYYELTFISEFSEGLWRTTKLFNTNDFLDIGRQRPWLGEKMVIAGVGLTRGILKMHEWDSSYSEVPLWGGLWYNCFFLMIVRP